MKRVIALCLTVVVCLSLLAGCDMGGVVGHNTRQITDGAGREVSVPEKVESIVCVGVGALRYTCYMGAQDRVVGVEDCEKEAAISRLYNFVNIELFQDLPVTGTNGVPFPEEIIKVAPDVIVMSKSASVDADDLQNKTGTPVVVVPGSDTTLDDAAYETIRILGQLYGLEQRAAALKDYLQAFKAAGADGVIMAEPAAGMLSPSLAEEFSMPFVQEIFDAVDDPDFIICYHNCGNAVADMLPAITQLHADIFHFGNAIDLQKALQVLPNDKIVMGNVDPVLLQTGTAEEVRQAVRSVYDRCGSYDNFMISTGCDVPAAASWENIDAYFMAVKELYG